MRKARVYLLEQRTSSKQAAGGSELQTFGNAHKNRELNQLG